MNRIRALISDVDGVLTNGLLFIGPDGTEDIKVFHVKDGMGIRLMQKAGLLFGVISGRDCKALKARMNKLDVFEVHTGQEDKLTVLKSLMERHKLEAHEIAYIGDDVNDLELGEYLTYEGGVFACPADAVRQVRNAATLVLEKNGGQGAVRDLIDRILEARGKCQIPD